MSACAGSLTDASRSVWPRCRPKVWLLSPDARESFRDCFGPQERNIQSISPAWSRWIAPGRIGFMSTQRREDHLRLAHCKDRAGSSGDKFPGSPARELFARAAGRTAPPEDPARTATNSLSSDCRNQQPVRLFSLTSALVRRPWAGSRAEAVARASSRLSAHPFLRRSCASPSDLAACTGSHGLPDGKVRWQKKFAFPARRMRRGLRF